MAARVVVSCYCDKTFEFLDSAAIPEPTLIYSRSLITDMPLDDIERLLDTGDGFQMERVAGEHLSFLDFYYFWGQEVQAVEKIDSIPESTVLPEEKEVDGTSILILFAANDALPAVRGRILLSYKRRYEQGASGWSEGLAYLSNNPWIMLFIGYYLEKALDFVGKKLNIHLRKQKVPVQKELLTVNFKKVYKNAGVLFNCDKKDLQITSLSASGKGKIKIVIRTYENERYQLICTRSGDIISCDEKRGAPAHEN